MLRSTLDYARARFGAGAPARLLAELPAHTRELLGDEGERLLVGGWYDYMAVVELTAALERLYGAEAPGLPRAVGRAIAFEDLNRFFKWLLRLAGPTTLFTRAASVFNNYHSVGRYVVEHVGPGRAVIRLEDWDSAHPLMCLRIEGWIERALELTLGQAARPTIRETHHAAHETELGAFQFCRFVAEWEE
jgi:hypothetical protein